MQKKIITVKENGINKDLSVELLYDGEFTEFDRLSIENKELDEAREYTDQKKWKIKVLN